MRFPVRGLVRHAPADPLAAEFGLKLSERCENVPVEPAARAGRIEVLRCESHGGTSGFDRINETYEVANVAGDAVDLECDDTINVSGVDVPRSRSNAGRTVSRLNADRPTSA